MSSFRFALLTDLQQADKEAEHVESAVRDYRNARFRLQRAVAGLNEHAHELAFAIHLGDIIDGNVSEEKNEEDLAVAVGEFGKLHVARQYHVLGNHCLMGMPRQRLYDALHFDQGPYYSFVVQTWRFIVLDCVDINVAWPHGTPNHDAAHAWLEAHKDAPNAKPWNGGISSTQLTWLRAELAAAEQANQWVVAFGHIPLSPHSASTHHLVYNADEVRQTLESCPRVRWYFAGHYHRGGYAKVGPIHHVTGEALLEAPSDSTAYAIVDVSDEHGLTVHGFGSFKSHSLPHQ